MAASPMEAVFPGLNVDFLGPKNSGKVRDLYEREDQLVLITTDRLSAFDHILGLVPFKGQVLNQLSAFWFEQTQDIVANHCLDTPDPNVTIGKKCQPLPVEVVVRGYISGVTKTSLWHQYQQGERNIYGLTFPDGLQKNDPLPGPVITPTTKAGKDDHDRPVTIREVVEMGLVEASLWEEVCNAALSLFSRGQEIAAYAGLLLVDTKYEFGIADDGSLTLIDEIHTPDSSRFWTASSFEEAIASRAEDRDGSQDDIEPENFDKEFVRLVYAAQGYIGDGPPPPLSEELAQRASERYIACYELLTGRHFEPGEGPTADRVARNLKSYFSL